MNDDPNRFFIRDAPPADVASIIKFVSLKWREVQDVSLTSFFTSDFYAENAFSTSGMKKGEKGSLF